MSLLSSKRFLLVASSVAGMLVMAFAVKDIDPLAPVKVSKNYQSDDFGKLSLVGVCQADSYAISCWNTEGKSDTALADKVKAYFTSLPLHTIQIKFRRKNRLVVFQRPPVQSQKVSIVGQSSMSGQPVLSAGGFSVSLRATDPYLEWYALDTDPTQTSTALLFSMTVPLGTVSIPLREGAEASLPSLKIHIDSVKPAPETDIRVGNGRIRPWFVTVTLSGPAGRQTPSLAGVLMDAGGDPVTRVDAKGNPFSKAQTLRFNQSGSDRIESEAASVTILEGADASHKVLSIVANPAKVASLSLFASGLRRVTITDIPLDPN